MQVFYDWCKRSKHFFVCDRLEDLPITLCAFLDIGIQKNSFKHQNYIFQWFWQWNSPYERVGQWQKRLSSCRVEKLSYLNENWLICFHKFPLRECNRYIRRWKTYSMTTIEYPWSRFWDKCYFSKRCIRSMVYKPQILLILMIITWSHIIPIWRL